MWAVVKIFAEYPNLPSVTLYDTYREAADRVQTFKGLEDNVILFTVVYAPLNSEIEAMIAADVGEEQE